MIEVKNLTRKYGQNTAVDDVSFAIPSGQIVGLLGHNGAGKTTTLKMITGFLEPTSGQILVDGKEMEQHRLAIQSRIGYLPENAPIYTEMTVAEYLEYVAEMRGVSEGARAEAIRAAVQATQIQDKLLTPIDTLSKGYRQRVGVAQAILHKPDILILDEPTNGLDPTQILAMRTLIKEIARTATVIVSTHILQEVEAICDRALIILDGRLVLDSKLDDLQKDNSITVTTDAPSQAVVAKLAALPGVKRVSPAPGKAEGSVHTLTVEVQGNQGELAASIAKLVIEAGWNLYTLHREDRDLEAVFREVNRGRLTHAKSGQPAAAAAQ